MKKDFNIKNFVEEYEKQVSDDDRTRFLKTKLKTEKYLPYSDKAMLAEHIVKSSSYAIVKNENDGKLQKTNRIKINSPMRYVLFVMTIIDKYTNLEVNFNDVMPEFDYLNRNNLFEVIFNKIGDKEIGEFNTVVDMVLNDFMTNEYEFKNFVSEMVSKANGIVQQISPIINNITDKFETLSDNDLEKVSNWFNKLGKLIK